MTSHYDHLPRAYYNSPTGTIEVAGDERGIASVIFIETASPSDDIPPFLKEPIRQLDEYFRGERTEFSLQLAPAGTEFERSVWERLVKIPFGETRSYMEIANAIGNPKAVRAVGHANGQNPLWIVIPCHRVIGGNGSLTGYAGGIRRKEWLLRHESVVAGKMLF